jgi:hypothetical protein
MPGAGEVVAELSDLRAALRSQRRPGGPIG